MEIVRYSVKNRMYFADIMYILQILICFGVYLFVVLRFSIKFVMYMYGYSIESPLVYIYVLSVFSACFNAF